MSGRPWHGRRKAITPTQRQQHWRQKKHRLETGKAKREKRKARVLAMAGTIRRAEIALGNERRLFRVIYADPPWRWEPYSRETGMDRAADNHYSTLPTKEITEMKVLAAPDCVLFLWARVPMLGDALTVMKAWRFEHKTAYAWLKPGPGHGYWSTTDQIELLLVGTRGDVPAPAPGAQPLQTLTIPRGKHSAKPDAFAEMIERTFPNLSRLEMFARRQRPGWTCWGAEA
jgi:N6-adenosine-specific RNA methylase IME4